MIVYWERGRQWLSENNGSRTHWSAHLQMHRRWFWTISSICISRDAFDGGIAAKWCNKVRWQGGKTTHLGVSLCLSPIARTMTKLKRSALSRFIIAHNGSNWTQQLRAYTQEASRRSAFISTFFSNASRSFQSPPLVFFLLYIFYYYFISWIWSPDCRCPPALARLLLK